MNSQPTNQPPEGRLGNRIYIASKTKHASKWLRLRGEGVNIISTWIDEAGMGESKDMSDLCRRCIKESKECDAMIVYAEEGDVLKGAFIEMGVALSTHNKPVYFVGPVLPSGSAFTYSGQVHAANTVLDAIARINATPPATVINFDLREVQQWLNNELIKLGGQHKHGAKEDDEYYLGKWAAFDEVRIYLSNSPAKNIQPLQWVKASERLPNSDGIYYCKSTNDNGDTLWKGTRRLIDNEFDLENYTEDNLQWLDESTPPNQPKEISDELSGEPIKIDVIKEIESCFQLTATPVTPNQLSGIEVEENVDYRNLNRLYGELNILVRLRAKLAKEEILEDGKWITIDEKRDKVWEEIQALQKLEPNPFKAGYAASEGEEAIGVLDWIVENKWVGEFDDFCGYMWYQITESGTSNYINSNQLANLYKLSKK